MKAVILAAGKGTRMGSLTELVPKPLLKVSGKTLLEHKLDVLPDVVDEVIMVVGYRADVIRSFFSVSHHNIKIKYATQKDHAGGTADALWQCRTYLKGRFLVMMGDDLYCREDIDTCLAHKDWTILVQQVPDTRVGGKVILDNQRHVVDILEKNTGGAGFVNTNMFVLDTRIFDISPVPKAPGSLEFGLPQTVLAASTSFGIPLRVVPATHWIQITNPNDLMRAENLLTQ